MDTQINDMNAIGAKECLYEKKQIVCTKSEYHRDVRDSILDYELRCKDIGDVERTEFCKTELARLDKLHGLPPA